MTQALIPPGHAVFVHVTTRCVRRAWLFGYDRLNNRRYDHRCGLIETRVRELAENFAVGVYAFAWVIGWSRSTDRDRRHAGESQDARAMCRRHREGWATFTSRWRFGPMPCGRGRTMKSSIAGSGSTARSARKPTPSDGHRCWRIPCGCC